MRKFYLILSLFLVIAGHQAAKGQDTTGCTATFQVTVTDSLFTFRAMDSMPGVQHSWNFGDGSVSAAGVVVTHFYPAPGTYAVTQTVSDPAQNCQNSSTQMISAGNPAATCNVYINFYKTRRISCTIFSPLPAFREGRTLQ